jgi:FAD/FMN-containing dehydrogenase
VPIVPRGGGTSQCGQTVGAGLVIDHAKHVRNILDVDLGERTAEVEPGIVLDHLNASLKQHGLWYPVDVSTSAQATLGGMAGNNSCGSRSIAYGNMVHNVLGATAWRPTAACWSSGATTRLGGAARELGDYVKALSASCGPSSSALAQGDAPRGRLQPGHLQQPERKALHRDGSVNLAHLLVGSEGTLALTKSLKLRLAELPRTKVLGVVNFPTFYKAMDTAQHIVQLGGDGTLSAVELVDRTMIELSLQNPAFAPTVRTALIGSPMRFCWWSFRASPRPSWRPRCASWSS